MRYALNVLGLASVASAHTLFTTFFVNGENQGDGTCVRMPEDGKTATAPIYPLNGDDMACGRDGNSPVSYICPSPAGATLTFEYRLWPNAEEPGSIDDSHKGPCSVYMKKVDDMFSDEAAGSGWFKVWEDGYHPDTDDWCVDTLIENNGLLSVDLPTGLPPGNYLVRPELIALHQAYRGDPQFYHGCAQVFIEEGPDTALDIPSEYEVSIPGYLEADHPGLTFNLYEDSGSDYEIPGPKVYNPASSSTGLSIKQDSGAVPGDCLIKNANWCAKPVPKSSDVESCWDSVDDCWAQSKKCWDSVPVSGYGGCTVWSDYCDDLGAQCEKGNYDGPLEFTGEEASAPVPGDIPQSYNSVFEATQVGGSDSDGADKPADKPAEESADQPEKSIEDTADKTTAVVDAQPTATREASKEEEGSEDDYETPSEDDSTFIPLPEVASGLKISEDGRCGGETGQTCIGSSFGNCCSKKGKCGRKTRHCTCGCQSDFGECRQ